MTSISNIIFYFGVLLICLNGLWEYIGFSSSLTKFFFLIIITLLLSLKILTSISQKYLIFFIILFPLYISQIYSHGLLVSSISLFQVYSPIFLFYIFYNNFKYLEEIKIKKFFYIFILFQILAAILKYLVIGQSEGGGIGTISIQAGSLSTFLVFFMCLIAISSNKQNVFFIFCFFIVILFFNYINEKRLGFIIICIFFILYFFNKNKEHSVIKLSSILKPHIILFTAFIFIIFLYFSTFLLPTLLDGYDISDFHKRIIDYSLQFDQNNNPRGRISGIIFTLDQFSFYEIFFGKGATMFFGSNILDAKNIITFPMVSILTLISRFGLYGVLIYIIFFLNLKKKLGNEFYSNLFLYYLLFDFLIYSDSFFLSYSQIFLFSLFIIHQKKNLNKY